MEIDRLTFENRISASILVRETIILCSWSHTGQKLGLCGTVLISSGCCSGSCSVARVLGPLLLMGAAGLLPAHNTTPHDEHCSVMDKIDTQVLSNLKVHHRGMSALHHRWRDAASPNKPDMPLSKDKFDFAGDREASR